MLRHIRNKLRMIRYYSAAPRKSPWSRAMDAALLAALALALPMAFVADSLLARSEPIVDVKGYFWRQSLTGPIVSASLANVAEREIAGIGLVPAGNFSIEVRQVRGGWPVTTSIRRQAAVLTLDLLSEPRPRTNVQLDEDDPLRAALVEALEAGQAVEALRAINQPQGSARWLPLGLTMAAGIWWLALSAAAWALVGLAWLATAHVRQARRRRRAARLASGVCAACGYDLRGLEFAARCPECGELV